MRLIIVGGSGFIGGHLTDYYLAQGASIVIIGRSLSKIHERFGSKVEAIDWESMPSHGKTILNSADLIVNLSGAGIADQRWSAKRQRIIVDSRVNTTQCLARVCAERGPDSPPLFNASAIGIYGIQRPETEGLPPALNESSPLSEVATDFGSSVVREWERGTRFASEAGVRVLCLRFGAVLGKQGGMLARMKPLFKLGLGGRVGSGHQPLSWISIIDLCRAIDFLFQHPDIHGPVNVVSPNTITQADFAKVLGRLLHRPTVFAIPAFLIKWAFGQMGEELLLNGQHVIPTELCEHGFSFQYPDIQEAVSQAL